MIFKRITLCYRSEKCRNYADEILLHFSNRTLYCYFWTKMAKSGYWVRNAVPVYQWKKNKRQKTYFTSYPISKSFNTEAQVIPWMLLFCWGREDLVELFLFLTGLSCKQHVISILLNSAAQITLLFSKISNILDTRV